MLVPRSLRATFVESTGRSALTLVLLFTIAGCAGSGPNPSTANPSPPTSSSPGATGTGAEATSPAARDLLADPSLWSKIVFGGEGPVEFVPVADAKPPTYRLMLDLGDPLTGVLYAGDVDALFGPSRDRYAIEFEARRVRGNDFFCGVTFPIGADQHATLILGGWGGSLAGLSSLDGFDASQNGTTQYRKFERKRWYSVRIEVLPQRIVVTLDEEPLFTVDRRTVGEFSVRAEVLPTVPFGLCTFMTEGEVRRLFVERLLFDGDR